jgi:hypothetical protein
MLNHSYLDAVALTRRGDRGPLPVGLLPLGGAHVVRDHKAGDAGVGERETCSDRVANGGAAEPTATRRFGRSPNRRPRRPTCLEVWPNTSVWQETDYDLANQRLTA